MRGIANLQPYKNYRNLIKLMYPFNKTLNNGKPSQNINRVFSGSC